jgi:hypothetical protein
LVQAHGTNSLNPGRLSGSLAPGSVSTAARFFSLLFAGWVNRQQQAVIDYGASIQNSASNENSQNFKRMPN